MEEPIWTPSLQAINHSHMAAMMRFIQDKYKQSFASSDDFYKWSITYPELFWSEVWDWGNVKGYKDPETFYVKRDQFNQCRFFEASTLNYAENLLAPWEDEGAEALVFWGEDKVKRSLNVKEVKDQVKDFRASFKRLGLKDMDRVAGFMPNMPETITSMMAAASMGCIWSSCSPDFGVQGVLDRLRQIGPKVLITVDGYYFKGKVIDLAEKIQGIARELLTLEEIIVVPYVGIKTWQSIPKTKSYKDLEGQGGQEELTFTQVPFNHPLFIMFSSGTTGAPKCIVHGHGGSLLQHIKEHQLHSDIKPGDRVFYYTTCGWMMWNWLATGLASKATLVLYDGSPFAPKEDILFKMAQDEKVTFFGISAKYIDALHKADISPCKDYDLKSIRTIASTGSPLMPENYDYVYQHISPSVCLASISGGTDIISCFALGDPTKPVYRGELQTRGLGMAVEVWDDNGKAVANEKGELVCTHPFPSMPVGFWDDEGGEKYYNAYFDKYPNTWCHGDFCSLTSHGGIVIYGRSDTVLNPGGVRIGTAEIYRQVEKIGSVLESVAVGQEWDGDVRVVLFVKLKEGISLDDPLIAKIKSQIRSGASPRHVPDVILAAPDIPRTISGKISEKAVSDMIHGRAIKNKEALANPEALEFYGNCMKGMAA